MEKTFLEKCEQIALENKEKAIIISLENDQIKFRWLGIGDGFALDTLKIVENYILNKLKKEIEK